MYYNNGENYVKCEVCNYDHHRNRKCQNCNQQLSPDQVINGVKEKLVSCGQSIDVLILGATAKGMPNHKSSRLNDVYTPLANNPLINVEVSDPYADVVEFYETYGIKLFAMDSERSESFDVIIFLVDHDAYLPPNTLSLKIMLRTISHEETMYIDMMRQFSHVLEDKNNYIP